MKSIALALAGAIAVVAASADQVPGFSNRMPDQKKNLESALLSARSYSWSDVEAAENFKEGPFTALWAGTTDAGTDAAVVISTTTNTTYVVFRGSDGEPADRETNFDYVQVPFILPNSPDHKLGLVHRGYFQGIFGADAFYAKLDAVLLQSVQEFPDYEISVTGHSLGSAQAMLYSVHLALDVFPSKNIDSYTIGGPRVGNNEFKESVEAIENLHTIRMVNQDDIIPRLPLDIMGYAHTGHLLHWYWGKMTLHYQHDGDRVLGHAGVPAKEWDLDVNGGVERLTSDHNSAEYIRIIRDATRDDLFPTQFAPYVDGDVDSTERCYWLGLGIFCYDC